MMTEIQAKYKISPTPRVDILDKILRVADGDEVIANLICDLLLRAQERGVERRCNIGVHFEFNDKGYARHWNIDDGGVFPKPKIAV